MKVKVQTAIEFFGSAAELARALGVGRSAVSNWLARGEYLPRGKAFELFHLTGGKLGGETPKKAAKSKGKTKAG